MNDKISFHFLFFWVVTIREKMSERKRSFTSSDSRWRRWSIPNDTCTHFIHSFVHLGEYYCINKNCKKGEGKQLLVRLIPLEESLLRSICHIFGENFFFHRCKKQAVIIKEETAEWNCWHLLLPPLIATTEKTNSEEILLKIWSTVFSFFVLHVFTCNYYVRNVCVLCTSGEIRQMRKFLCWERKVFEFLTYRDLLHPLSRPIMGISCAGKTRTPFRFFHRRVVQCVHTHVRIHVGGNRSFLRFLNATLITIRRTFPSQRDLKSCWLKGKKCLLP